MRYAVRLYDDAVRGAVSGRVTDGQAVRPETVRADLWLADHAAA